MFTLRILRDAEVKTNYTLLYERYNIETEEMVVLNQHKMTLPEKITADIIKFIQGRKFSAPFTHLTDDELPKYEPKFDVVVVYRNDEKGKNESFGYDIRDLKDLGQIKFAKAVTSKAWIDIGGRKNWRKYAFPVVKMSPEESMQELGVSKEVVVVCPFETIVLVKGSSGNYIPMKNLAHEKMQSLDLLRKTFE
jgi:hypothetical protein